MDIKKLDYIDFEEVNTLLEGFNKSTGFVTAILDLEGNVLSKSGWRQICTEFHRINPETSKNCSISDTVLANKLDKNEKYHFYECLNGLVDVAVPIVINGEHIANLFSGQFFFDEPDRDFFKKQAKRYGFNEQNYLKALEDVPIVSKEKVKIAMDFLLNMTQLISEITLQKFEQSQLNEALRKSEERSRSALDNMLEGCQIIGFDWRYIYLNRTAEIHNRRPNNELIGNRYMDMWPGIENTKVFKIIKQVLEKRVSNHFENEFLFPDGSLGWFDLSIQPVPEGVFILSIDITERKLKEEQLYESEFRFGKLWENGPFGMMIVDQKFQYTSVNPVFCKILGYSETELQHLTFKDISYPDDLVKDIPNIKKLMNRELSVYKTEKRYIRKDGQLIWGALTVTSNYDKEGHFLYNLAIVEDITRRKLAEEDLKKSKKLLSETESIGKVGGWEFSIDTLITTWTDEVYRIHEVDFDFNSNVNSGINFYTTASKPIIERAVQRAIEFSESFDLELEIITAKGNLRKVHTIGQADPEQRRVYGFFQDITERKQVEERLQRSETRFSSLFNQMQEGFALHEIICDSTGKAIDYRFLEINPAFEKLTGLKRSEIIGRTVLEVMPDTETLWIERYGDVALNGNPIEFENYSAPLNRYYQIKSFCPAKKQFAVLFSDISERKHAEETLRKLEYILSEGQKIAHMGTFEYNLDTQATYWSAEEYSIYGLDPDGPSPSYEVMIAKCIHPDDAAILNQTFGAAIQSQSVYELEHRIIKPDGSIRWVFDRAYPYFDQNGNLARYVGATLDITDRKQAEENIRILNEDLEKRVNERTAQLEAANKELEAFSYSVSHDLRSPLRHINGFAEILSKQHFENLPEDAREHLNTITIAAKKMGTLIDDLLSFSRTARTEMKKSNFTMNKVVDEALAQINHTVMNRKIDWKISQLPEIYGDYNLLRQVWINLIENAVKYTRARENTVIEIAFTESDKETVFHIKDNGVGFDMKYANKLFGVFQRLHSSSQFEGTGIGLANVQRIILRLGGKTWAEAEPDKGATFFFSIPK